MSSPHVLIVEDQRALALALAASVRHAGASSEIAPSAAIARRMLEEAKTGFDAMILDIGLPDENGLDFFATLSPATRPPAIVVTAHGEIDNTIGARKLGIADFLTKPLDFGVFTESLQRVLPKPSRESQAETGRRGPMPFIGASVAMRAAFQQIAHACAATEPVLISGETGTGKSLAASLIRHNSVSLEAPFAAFPSGAEEIGEVLRGSADGILLIEEIGELDSRSQLELIRRWEQDDESFPRIIATASGDLREAVASDRLRSDLFYRLQVLEIQLPPLRERLDDLPALFEFFLGEAAPERTLQVDREALERLQACSWPGNLRELRSVASFAATISAGATRIGMAELPDYLNAETRSADPGIDEEFDRVLADWIRSKLGDQSESPTYRELSGDLERRLIRHLLDRHDGKLARLATEMKANRTTLRKKLRDG